MQLSGTQWESPFAAQVLLWQQDVGPWMSISCHHPVAVSKGRAASIGAGLGLGCTVAGRITGEVLVPVAFMEIFGAG